MKFIPHDYQKRAIRMILEKPDVGLFLDMGLGKTVISLTAVKELLDDFDVYRVLVIAPLKVAEDTWSRESEKWDHLKGLRVAKILGDRKIRTAAAESEADIYVINRENTKWLVENYKGKKWKWDMLIIDELSSFKNHQSERFKALKHVRLMFRRIVGLTGTPDPNGLMDLWAEMFLIDGGERLGKFIGRYRAMYFKSYDLGYTGITKYEPLPDSERLITQKISDITISMKAKDYIDLPDRIDNVVHVHLTDKERKAYKKLEAEGILELESDEITAFSAAACMNKLLQYAGGAVYTDSGGFEAFHDEKIKALEEIIEAADSPVLVFYGFRHEKARLLKALEKYEPRSLENESDIKDWNDGKIKVLLAHPASVGYGLNLQDGGHIIAWFSLPWSLEYFLQANARLYRQGQMKPVIVNYLIADDTVDEAVLNSLRNKNLSQELLLRLLKERKTDGSKDKKHKA